ncbi:Calcium-dependent protein [Vigna angularis]|uniref:Calcium-dependent protein n=1 Tax=Phaseolus angularis TaxID=3914 RepID=A0A8T0K5E1_PHAAN|nr:Calcium-dependent protein [Vigna angularis]
MAFPESPETQTKPENVSNSNCKSHRAERHTPSLLRPIENHDQAKFQIASAATNPKSPKPLRYRAFISQAPLQRRHPPSTPPSMRKILASRDILSRVIAVIQRRHHLQQTSSYKSTGRKHGCKSIPKWRLTKKTQIDDMKRGIMILQHLSDQPNIIEFKGAYKDWQNVHLVMEWCLGCELFGRCKG